MSGYNPEWMEYYIYLENLRQSGIVNVFGASPFLARRYGLTEKKADEVLGSWMENYEALLEVMV